VKKIVYLFAGCLIVMLPFSAQAFKLKEGQDCLNCHKLKKTEAQEIIERIVPNGKVIDIKASPMIKGAWQIDVQRDAQHGAVLLDFSKKFLIGLTPVPKRVNFSKIPLTDAIVLGPAAAKKKVIVFTDPDCPYCRELHQVMKQIVAKSNDISFSLILNPLPMHKDAYKKAQAILCEKSTTLLDDAFAGKAVPEPACSNERLEKNIALAKEFGFSGTPTLVREDGTVLSGYLQAEKLLEWIGAK